MWPALVEHLRVDWRSALRSPSQLLMAYLFPLGFALVLGGVMPDLNPMFRAGMVPAFALVAVTAGALLGLPGPMVEARTTGVLRGFRVVGVPDFAAVSIPGVSAALHALLSAVLVSLVCVALFHGEAPAHPAAFLGVIALTAFTFTGLGTLIGVLASSARATMLISQAIFLPSMVLGGLMVPWAALPAHVRPLSVWLPTTHAMQLLDALAYGRAPALAPWMHAAALFGCGAVAWALAAVLFDTEPREHKPWRVVLLAAAMLPLGLTALAL